MSTPSPWQYFTMEELTCHCGCRQMKMSPIMMPKLVAVRRRLGFPLPIGSGYRCPRYNAQVSETGTYGPHTTGHAVDVEIRGSSAYRLIQAAIDAGFTGIGVQQKGAARFIHLDDLTQADGFASRPWVWSY